MQLVIASFMCLMGIGIAGIWTRDIMSDPEVDISNGLFSAREPGSGSLFWLHWLAEYGTAAGLIAGAVGVFVATPWATSVSLVALGALAYTSINSLGWAFSRRDRYVYGVPMLVGAAGSMASIVAVVLM
jgi:phosphoglycerol transferase MdoB-like AlkP superfamily enzyme